MRPNFSVITAVFNGVDHLESCLHSVSRQDGNSVEHIVIDGGSTDGSVDILKRNAGGLRYWVSEPDHGIGDAMNKGIRQAQGEWVIFLHSDDEFLANDSLASVHEALAKTHADIVGFPILFGTGDSWRVLKPRGGNAWLRFKSGFLHQGTFIRRSVFEKIGEHDTRFRIAMDYEFFLRAMMRGVPMETLNSPLTTRMRNTGVSSQLDWDSLSRRLDEERDVHALHAGSPLQRLVYACYWALYRPYRRLRARLSANAGA